MTDGIVVAKAALSIANAGRALGPLINAYLGRDSGVLEDLMRKADAAWVTEFCEHLRERQEVLDQRFEELHPLVTSLRWEAARDATSRRRSMLAHVAAYLLNSTATVESKARIERAVRGLDPEDISLLALLAVVSPAAAFGTWEGSSRRSNVAACVDIDYLPRTHFIGAERSTKPQLRLSATGGLVIDALSTFLCQELLAGFEPNSPRVNLFQWLKESPPSGPVWLALRSTHPVRLIQVDGGPSIRGEVFCWDESRNAYVLRAVAAHYPIPEGPWSLLSPLPDVCFLRQDNSTNGRPLITCDPLANATSAELEFVNLRNVDD